MTAAEVSRFAEALADARTLVEFGAGGSTLLAARSDVARIVAVENDPAWVARIVGHKEIAAAQTKGRLEVLSIDIGAVVQYGFPVDDSKASSWPQYWQSPWKRLNGSAPDLVLIDGRFRLACGLETVRRCPSATTLMIHDFWNRPHYHLLLMFVDVVDRVDSLAILRPRASMNWDALEWVGASAALDPR